MYKFIYLFVLFALNVGAGQSARILAVFPSLGYSQYILAEPLLIELAGRGHNVTVISAFGTKNVDNLTNIVLVHSSEQENDDTDMLWHLQDLSIFENIVFINNLGLDLTEKTLADSKVQELIQSKEKFDLVLMETFYNDALQAFATHFNAHQVLFHSMALNEWNSHLVANPNLPSYLPNSFGGYTTRMTLGQRFRNALALWFARTYRYFIQQQAQQALVNRYFPNQYDLQATAYNASLILTCSHVSTAESVPLTSSVIEVGGLHIRNNNKSLPREVKRFLDSANEGAVFFSLGSNVKSSSLPQEVVEGIMQAIGKLKQKVLWKFEDHAIGGKPDNLMISKWFQQNDILAHPNTILFISHCGMGSTTEAIYHGVPVLGIPIYGDQFMNIKRLESFGMGLELPLKQLSGKTFEDSINRLLNNPNFKSNAKKRSRITKDRPVQPLELAVYWIEYVLRQEGAHHLKNAIFALEWYQLYLVDVVALLLLILSVIIYIIFIVVRFLRHCLVVKSKTE